MPSWRKTERETANIVAAVGYAASGVGVRCPDADQAYVPYDGPVRPPPPTSPPSWDHHNETVMLGGQNTTYYQAPQQQPPRQPDHHPWNPANPPSTVSSPGQPTSRWSPNPPPQPFQGEPQSYLPIRPVQNAQTFPSISASYQVSQGFQPTFPQNWSGNTELGNTQLSQPVQAYVPYQYAQQQYDQAGMQRRNTAQAIYPGSSGDFDPNFHCAPCPQAGQRLMASQYTCICKRRLGAQMPHAGSPQSERYPRHDRSSVSTQSLAYLPQPSPSRTPTQKVSYKDFAL